MKQSKPVIAWGGFDDGKLDTTAYFSKKLAIYITKKDAEKVYTDVRKVEIREVKE